MASTLKEKDKLNIAAAEEKFTEEEYEKRRREKIKNNVGNVLKIVGIISIIFMAYICILDPLFELTFFGAMFNNSQFNFGWNALMDTGTFTSAHNGTMETTKAIYDNAYSGINLYDAAKYFGALGITIIYIGVILLLVFLVTLYTTEIIMIIRNIAKSSRFIITGSTKNVKDGIEEATVDIVKEKKSKSKTKDLFGETPEDKAKAKKADAKKENKKVKNEKTNHELDGYTSEQLEAMLRGEGFDTKEDEKPDDEPKSLFDDETPRHEVLEPEVTPLETNSEIKEEK